MKYRPHPRYKESGLEWLGEIPKDWGLFRGGFLMRVNPPAERLRSLRGECEVSFVPMEAIGVHGGVDLSQSKTISDMSSGYTEFEEGERAAKNEQVIQLRQANPFDKFQLGLRKLIEDFMIQRMSENDKIVTRYMGDKDFESAAFSVLSKEIFR